jgi:hypothetical protein
MNTFISLTLADGGIVAVRPDKIVAVESYEPGIDTVRVEGITKAYDVVAGQFTLNKLGEHCSHAGVRVA